MASDDDRSNEGLSILLVEDDELAGQTIAELLRSLGHAVTYERDPGAALALVEQGAGAPDETLAVTRDAGAAAADFDLLLTDVVMPGMNGRQLFEAVEQLRPGLPVLFMSGNTGAVFDDWDRRETQLLQKPFRPSELRDALAEVLRRARRAV